MFCLGIPGVISAITPFITFLARRALTKILLLQKRKHALIFLLQLREWTVQRQISRLNGIVDAIVAIASSTLSKWDHCQHRH
ncbi:hypothetical protein ACHAXS_003234 [Conticribra weissflogii]